jgi:hypothetical protein
MKSSRARFPMVVGFSVLTVLGCSAGEIKTGPNAQEFKILSSGECPADLDDGALCIIVPTPEDIQPPEEGGCWVTGIGTFGKGDTRDSFGGNGMTMKDGSVRGEWNHVDHLDESGSQKNGQNHFHGQVDYLNCFLYPTLNGPDVPKATPNYAIWGGAGTYNNEEGYTFEVRAFDHSEPGAHHDRYEMDVWGPDGALVLHADGTGTYDTPPKTKGCLEDVTVTDPQLSWVPEMGCISGGNFQIHPPNQGHPY